MRVQNEVDSFTRICPRLKVVSWADRLAEGLVPGCVVLLLVWALPLALLRFLFRLRLVCLACPSTVFLLWLRPMLPIVANCKTAFLSRVRCNFYFYSTCTWMILIVLLCGCMSVFMCVDVWPWPLSMLVACQAMVITISFCCSLPPSLDEFLVLLLCGCTGCLW